MSHGAREGACMLAQRVMRKSKCAVSSSARHNCRTLARSRPMFSASGGCWRELDPRWANASIVGRLWPSPGRIRPSIGEPLANLWRAISANLWRVCSSPGRCSTSVRQCWPTLTRLRPIGDRCFEVRRNFGQSRASLGQILGRSRPVFGGWFGVGLGRRASPIFRNWA